ncbi:hypothetical protein ASPVEDRAFT_23997 [Aspergillus versicolor CBS 583.65]|uniref:Uncharacterized protein n=1 Tax=Aspergillus versicolor CBS 583.65 TaxID=1036611 RepID=A0A1L9P671_ASPVE|nr:uncharacterized protein ASPVEDRAFT_23997 [Aspergillus versicolor CBS 583.65]OJI97021.1 hypothetical protein ASPVEDRAFT_23997 [Aspergillus versicolor CBS 583.65]
MSKTGKRVGAFQIMKMPRHVSVCPAAPIQPLRKSRPTTKHLPSPYTVFVLLRVRIRSLSSPSNIDSQTGRIVIPHYSFESFAFDASQEVEGFVTYNKVTKFGRTSEESWNQEHERIMMDKKPKRVDSGIRISDPRPIDDRQLHYTLETRTIVNELDAIIQEERDRRHHQAGVFRHVMHGSALLASTPMLLNGIADIEEPD